MSDVSRLPAAPDRVAATRRAVAHAAGTQPTEIATIPALQATWPRPLPKRPPRRDATKPQRRGYGLKKCKKTSFGNGPPKCKWFFRSSFFFFGQALQNKNPRHKAGDCCCISGRWEVCLAHPAAHPLCAHAA
jgi:hypothetical protein